MLLPNQSIHITIKEPPKTVRSIGIFDTDEIVLSIIQRFLEGEPKSPEFVQNTTEEVYLLLTHSRVLTVTHEDEIYTIKVRKIR